MGFCCWDFFMVVQNYGYLEVPRHMRYLLDEITGDGLNRFAVVRKHIIYVLVFTIVLALAMFLMRKLIIGVSRKIEFQLREKLDHKLLAMDYFFFRKNETGDLMSRCTNDLNHVRTLLGPGVMYVPNSLIRLFLFVPVLIGLSGKLMLILGGIMVFLILTILVLMPLLRPLFKQIQEAMGGMNNRVWQVISGISTIKQYTAEEVEIQRFRNLNEDYVKHQMAVVKLQGALRPLFFFLFALTELVILWVGGKQVIRGQMTMGELLQFNIMVSHLAFPVLSLGWIMSLMQQGIAAMGRVNHILHYPVEVQKGKEQASGEKIELEVRGLSFRYPDDTEEVLRNIHLTIRPGETIGITGPVGSGKSTLLNIMTGLIMPQPGQVFVNGTDIVEIDLESLNSQIAVVAQDPFLFSRTVAENIALGPGEMARETICQSADSAGLASDIEGFNDGYHQEIGERGITLSGGQKQRVAIARALAKCAPLLVLDDPLSNVDASTEARILENLETVHCFNTLLFVSHRVSVLKTADVIHVLKDGEIVETGPHNDLLRKENGVYARLAELQQMEELE